MLLCCPWQKPTVLSILQEKTWFVQRAAVAAQRKTPPHHVLAVLSACCVFMTEPCHALTLQEKAWFAQRAAVAAQRKAQRNAAAGQGGKITRESSYCSSWQHFERVCSAIAVLLFAVSGRCVTVVAGAHAKCVATCCCCCWCQ
jgi:hypothetical protein